MDCLFGILFVHFIIAVVIFLVGVIVFAMALHDFERDNGASLIRWSFIWPVWVFLKATEALRWKRSE